MQIYLLSLLYCLCLLLWVGGRIGGPKPGHQHLGLISLQFPLFPLLPFFCLVFLVVFEEPRFFAFLLFLPPTALLTRTIPSCSSTRLVGFPSIMSPFKLLASLDTVM